MRYNYRYSARILAFSAALCIAGATSISAAAEPRISNLHLDLEDEQALLSFELSDAFDDKLLQRIESGLPSGFVFELALVRTRRSWFDKNLASGRLQVVAMYNAVTREYLINKKYNGALIESLVIDDLDELKPTLTSITRFAAFSLDGIQTQQRLVVQVRAELGTKTVFFFIPKTINTEWASTRRFRLTSEPTIE